MNKESLFLFLTRRRRRECEKGRRRERRSDLVPPRVEFFFDKEFGQWN
jgi:hypothetical protein